MDPIEGADVDRSDPSWNRPAAVDRLFDALADRRRRFVLHELRTHGTRMTLADLADELAVEETGTPITEIPPETVKRVYMSLYHTHVPKLADAGILEYDQELDSVALADESAELDAILDLLE